MKKLFSYVLVLFCVLGLCCNVYATETTPTAVVDVVDEFFECLEDNEICVFVIYKSCPNNLYFR